MKLPKPEPLYYPPLYTTCRRCGWTFSRRWMFFKENGEWECRKKTACAGRVGAKRRAARRAGIQAARKR